MAHQYDVFISYNNKNRRQVMAIVKALKQQGLVCWVYDLESRPGQRWIPILQEAIEKCASVAVFIGAEGIGSWQSPEVEIFLQRAMADRNTPVIPVLLPGAPDNPQLSHFLELFTWVDFRSDVEMKEALQRLIWGITGDQADLRQLPQEMLTGLSQPVAKMSTTRRISSWVAVVTVLIAFASLMRDYFDLQFVERAPALYALRVQVLDPQKHPVRTASLRISAGHEPQRLSDGWWEIEIPRAKLPKDGRVTIWAESTVWSPAEYQVVLGAEPNPSVTMHLGIQWVKVYGRVLDVQGQPLSGFDVSLVAGGQASVISDALGRFEFTVPKTAESKMRLRAQGPAASGEPAAVEEYCYVDKLCELILVDSV